MRLNARIKVFSTDPDKLRGIYNNLKAKVSKNRGATAKDLRDLLDMPVPEGCEAFDHHIWYGVRGSILHDVDDGFVLDLPKPTHVTWSSGEITNIY